MAIEPGADPYPKSMRETIKSVEATRSRRMTEEFDRITAEQKAELLKKYHPDHKGG